MHSKLRVEYSKSEIETLLSLTFGEAVEYWVTLNYTPALSDATQTDRLWRLGVTKKILSECSDELREKTLTEMNLIDFQTMYGKLKKSKKFKQKVTSRKKWQKFIFMIYRNIFNLGIITRNPCYGWATESGYSVKTKILSISDINKIININPISSTDFRDKVLMVLLADTGIRIESALNILLRDIRFTTENGMKQISAIEINESKYNISYIVSIGSFTSKIIMEYIDKIRPESDLNNLFVTDKGAFLTKRNAEKRFEVWRRRLGFYFTPHMFRVSVATKVAYETGSIEEVKKTLGIVTDSVAYRYIRASEKLNGKEIAKTSLVDEIVEKIQPKDNLGSNPTKLVCVNTTTSFSKMELEEKPNTKIKMESAMMEMLDFLKESIKGDTSPSENKIALIGKAVEVFSGLIALSI